MLTRTDVHQDLENNYLTSSTKECFREASDMFIFAVLYIFLPRQQNLWVNSLGSGSRPNV
jgi:hypothetical protein